MEAEQTIRPLVEHILVPIVQRLPLAAWGIGGAWSQIGNGPDAKRERAPSNRPQDTRSARRRSEGPDICNARSDSKPVVATDASDLLRGEFGTESRPVLAEGQTTYTVSLADAIR